MAAPDHSREWNPASLVARIRAGERSAEAELVERYSRGVGIILRRSSSDPGVVEDLYQEVFLRAVEKIRAGELREPERLSGFIASLAHNLTTGHFRRRSATGIAPARDTVYTVADHTPDPLDRVLQAEDDAHIRRVLEEIQPEKHRSILYRFYLGDEDKDRICRDLGLTSPQFNRVLHRARERFRELYQRAAREEKG